VTEGLARVLADMAHEWRRDWPPTRIAAVAGAYDAAYLEPTEPVRLALPDGYEPLR